jgi:hypothetical protein
MRNRNSTNFAAILAIGAACAAIILFSRGFAPPADRKLHSEIGRVLAREAMGLLRPGGQITVITRDTEAFPQPALEILLKSFQQEVRRGGDIPVGILALQLDPLRPVEVPPGDFYELIRRSTADRVIVSLLGPPVLTREQRSTLGRVEPKIISFCAGNLAQSVDFSELFTAGLLHVALLNRPTSATGGSAANGPGTFDRLYTVVRADHSTAPFQRHARLGVPRDDP